MENTFYLRKIRFTVYLILLLVIPLTNQAQSITRQGISCFGASVYNSSIVVNQTVGQPYSTTTSLSSQTSILPGFQQPLLKSQKSTVNTLVGIDVLVFPNPANSIINIQSEQLTDNYSVQIIDINGKTIFSEEVSIHPTYSIGCSNWERGTYILKVVDLTQNKYSFHLIIIK